MANIIKCDRCGKEHELFINSSTSPQVNLYMLVRNVSRNHDQDDDRNALVSRKDLCDQCIKDVRKVFDATLTAPTSTGG